MLGPWYVADIPTADIVVSVSRDTELLELDPYTSAAVVLHNPIGTVIPWGTTPTIDTDDDTVTIPAPSVTPFATAGEYQLYLRLSTAAGQVETSLVDAIQILARPNRPVVADIRVYLGADAASWTDPELQGALDAEAAAQRKVCRIGDGYPPDLGEALKRRVARNLAMRGLPLAVLQGDAESGSSTLPGRDPEVRRLETPYKKRVAL